MEDDNNIIKNDLKKRSVFNPKARIVRLLGEELISSELVAFTEIIKNSHDSDATRVLINFNGSKQSSETITITDNGSGMDQNSFVDNWLQFGGSWKRDQLFTDKGRPLLGKMGVGRFAADKIASKMYLTSRSKNNGKEIHAYFDWDEFDPHNKLLSELTFKWDVKKPEVFIGNKHGTQITLIEPRVHWDEKRLANLKSSLSRSIHPFGDIGKFEIFLNSNVYPSVSGKLNGLFMDNPHYLIKAHLEEDGVVTYKIESNIEKSFMWKKNGGLRTGPITINIFAWDLEKTRKYRDPISFDMRKLLKQWNGMMIFRDGFRVWPYGKNGDDWLGLDRRRVDNPVVKLGNNQIIGLINISSRYNPHLRDLTNREGIRETKAFDDLKQFIKEAVLPQIEKYRKDIRKSRYIDSVLQNLDSSYLEKFKKLKSSKTDLKEELLRIEKTIKTTKNRMKKLKDYRDLIISNLS
jgi:hypothetical protein